MSRGEPLPDSELRALEELVDVALDRADESGLPVIGYGEISLVLAWPREDPAFACKRLPPFPSRQRFEAYRGTVEDYLDVLRAAGVRPVETEMRALDRGDGQVAAYLVQPLLPAASLGPAVLRESRPDPGHPLVAAVAAAVEAAVSPRVGLDAQLSNWAWVGSELSYLDVSTPLLWSPDGRSRLDLDLLAQAYPAAVRWPLRRFVAPGILDAYRDRRRVYVDLAGNLLKERLEPWVPAFLAAANERLDEPLEEAEVRSYYRSDARQWELLLRVRRLDRCWRRRVRRRPYPYLLPGPIER